MNIIKPPLGVEPKYIWEIKRMYALREAIERYLDTDNIVPIKWISEYNEFIKVARDEQSL